MALKKQKGSEYSYNGNGVIDCYFIENESGYAVALVNDSKKTVSPVHGYHFPNIEYCRIKHFASNLGYNIR